MPLIRAGLPETRTGAAPPGGRLIDATGQAEGGRQDGKGFARQDAAVIGLVSTAHFFSHFYMFSFAPLFLFMRPDLGLSWTALGGLLTAFSIASGIGQYPMGVLVDRVGARVVLIGGMGLLATSMLMIGVIPVFWVMLVFAFLAGLGNSVFHPADYTILGTKVRPHLMGRAFSIHTFSGFAGWFAAVPLMTALAELWGWQTALIVAGGLGLAIVAALISQPRLTAAGGASGPQSSAARALSLKLLLSRPVLAMFLFFFVVGAVSLGVAQFMPAALNEKYALPLVDANMTLTVFLFAGAIGVLAGGFLADKTDRLDLVAASGFAAGAAAMIVVAFVDLPFFLLAAVIGFGGFMIGLISPSRDLLVKSISPPGASGRVFGLVSTALDVAGVFAPLYFGMLMDFGAPTWVFLSAAALLLMAIGSAVGATAWRHRGAAAQPAE